MARYTYETAQAGTALQTIPQGESVIAPLNAWFGLDEMKAPVSMHFWACNDEDEELVVISADSDFETWATSEAMDDVHIANAISAERSLASRSVISFGMGRGKTSAPVKAAWVASYRRIA